MLGRFGPFTAYQARQRAMEILGEVAAGRAPAAEANAEREAVTVESAAQSFCQCTCGRSLQGMAAEPRRFSSAIVTSCEVHRIASSDHKYLQR